MGIHDNCKAVDEAKSSSVLEGIVSRFDYELTRASESAYRLGQEVEKLGGSIPSDKDSKKCDSISANGLLESLYMKLDMLDNINTKNEISIDKMYKMI